MLFKHIINIIPQASAFDSFVEYFWLFKPQSGIHAPVPENFKNWDRTGTKQPRANSHRTVTVRDSRDSRSRTLIEHVFINRNSEPSFYETFPYQGMKQ